MRTVFGQWAAMMATATDRPPNGSVRARRVAYFVAVVQRYPNTTRQELEETLGWSEEEVDQLLADFRLMSKELTALDAA